MSEASAAIAASASNVIVSVSDASSRKVMPSAPKRSVSDHASVAATLRTPSARASAHPGASTRPVASASRK